MTKLKTKNKYDGSESAWETLNEIWDGCEDFELKIKELK